MNEYYIKFVIVITIFIIVRCENFDGTIENIYNHWSQEERFYSFSLKEDESEYQTIDSVRLSKPFGNSDDEIHVSFKALKKNVELNLKKIDYFIVGPNTPFYLLTNKTNSSALCNKHKILLDIKSLGGFYEDKNNSAFFYISVDANGTKQIEVGVMKDLTIQRISDYLILPDGQIHKSQKTNQYIVQENNDIPNNYSILTDAEMNDYNSPLSKIPKVIYPKILLMVESDFLNKSDAFEGGSITTIKYLINFWCRVHMMFRNLVQPEYRIRIAGIVIDQNDRILNSFKKIVGSRYGSSRRMEYELAYDGMKNWLLQSPSNCIPQNSYSIAMIHTPCFPKWAFTSLATCYPSKWGMVEGAAACIIENLLNIPSLTRMRKLALVYDDRFLNNVRLVVNQIVTALGVFKDKNPDPDVDHLSSFVSTVRPNQNEWSKYSLQGFKAFLKTNPTCLYDAPS